MLLLQSVTKSTPSTRPSARSRESWMCRRLSHAGTAIFAKRTADLKAYLCQPQQSSPSPMQSSQPTAPAENTHNAQAILLQRRAFDQLNLTLWQSVDKFLLVQPSALLRSEAIDNLACAIRYLLRETGSTSALNSPLPEE